MGPVEVQVAPEIHDGNAEDERGDADTAVLCGPNPWYPHRPGQGIISVHTVYQAAVQRCNADLCRNQNIPVGQHGNTHPPGRAGHLPHHQACRRIGRVQLERVEQRSLRLDVQHQVGDGIDRGPEREVFHGAGREGLGSSNDETHLTL